MNPTPPPDVPGSTPALGVQILGATRDAGRETSDYTLEVFTRTVEKTAERAAQVALAGVTQQIAAANGNGRRRQDLKDWLRIGITVLTLLLGAWWFLGDELRKRPTSEDVQQIIDATAPTQHPEMRAELKAHDERLHTQQRQLDRIETKVDGVGESLDEVKERLRRRR